MAGKRAAEAAAKLAAARKLTFAEAAQRYFNQHASKWHSAKHREAFLGTLAALAFPVLGSMDVAAIDTPDILRAIEPHWTTKAVTIDRTRNRIEQVLDWCVVRGHWPPGTNPAKWKGHLDQVLPPARKVAPVAHHAAMDYRQLPAFMDELRRLDSVAARALELLILTAARTKEIIGAQWSEIDFDSKTWIVPAQRMKGGREHRVPLSLAAIDLLHKLPQQAGNPHLFIGQRAGAGLTQMPLRDIMRRLGQSDVVTIHGFRSSFSNWCHEQTGHSSHTIEISLAHNVGTEVERAYRRTDMIAKRARLMSDWARYCLSPPARVGKAGGDVVALRGGR